MKIGPRITIATAVLVTLTMGVYAFFDLRAAAAERRENLIREARSVALTLRASLKATGLEEALKNAGEMAKDISNAGGPWRVSLLSAQDAESALPGPKAAQVQRLRTLQEIDVPDLHLRVEEGDTFIYVVPLSVPAPLSPTGSRIAGSLEVSRSVAPRDNAFRDEMARTFAVIGLTVAMTILAVIGLTRSLMTRPVEKLLAGIDDVARGDLSHVLLSERDDEIGALATRFNEMTRSLRESRAETKRQNEATLQLEHRLAQSEKLATIGQLAAEIAHEVGTPLNVIAGRSKAMARKAGDMEAVKKNSLIISEQTARITRIIQRLLDFTRRKIGTQEPASVALNQLVVTTVELLESKLSSAKIKQTLACAEGLPAVKGDAERLQQVLLNLLLNAIQAMPEGGALTVQTSVVTRRRPGLEVAPEQVYVIMAVTDSGVGIPPDRRDKIFEPFYTSKQESGGTGLGLAVCFGIVKEHDGWIELADVPGGGTTFSVYLPAADED